MQTRLVLGVVFVLSVILTGLLTQSIISHIGTGQIEVNNISVSSSSNGDHSFRAEEGHIHVKKGEYLKFTLHGGELAGIILTKGTRTYVFSLNQTYPTITVNLGPGDYRISIYVEENGNSQGYVSVIVT